MESNMEARFLPTPNSKIQPSFIPVISSSNNHPVHSTYNQNYAFRQNGSLPRKFYANTNVPIRNVFYNYSHGKKYFISIDN